VFVGFVIIYIIVDISFVPVIVATSFQLFILLLFWCVNCLFVSLYYLFDWFGGFAYYWLSYWFIQKRSL